MFSENDTFQSVFSEDNLFYPQIDDTSSSTLGLDLANPFSEINNNDSDPAWLFEFERAVEANNGCTTLASETFALTAPTLTSPSPSNQLEELLKAIAEYEEIKAGHVQEQAVLSAPPHLFSSSTPLESYSDHDQGAMAMPATGVKRPRGESFSSFGFDGSSVASASAFSTPEYIPRSLPAANFEEGPACKRVKTSIPPQYFQYPHPIPPPVVHHLSSAPTAPTAPTAPSSGRSDRHIETCENMIRLLDTFRWSTKDNPDRKRFLICPIEGCISPFHGPNPIFNYNSNSGAPLQFPPIGTKHFNSDNDLRRHVNESHGLPKKVWVCKDPTCDQQRRKEVKAASNPGAIAGFSRKNVLVAHLRKERFSSHVKAFSAEERAVLKV